MGPLNGYRILDLSTEQAGPTCTMILSDLGAEVIKLEPPCGDPSRREGMARDGRTVAYTSLNRGKKSVWMDLTDGRQRALFYKMAETADAVVVSAMPGELEALGCGYGDLKVFNRKLVYTAVTPYGQTGPLREVAADDMSVLAQSGLMSMVGDLGHPCVRIGTDITATLAGFYGAIGTLAALYAAAETGEGQLVDVAALDCVMAANEASVIRYYMAGMVPQTQGNKHPSTVPFGDYTCGDGKQLIVNIATDDQFARFITALDEPQVLDTELKYAAERAGQRDRMEKILEDAFAKFDAETLKARFDAANSPYGIINDVRDITESEHMANHKMIMNATYPDGTTLRCVACPLKISGMDERTEAPVSPLGYDTLAVASQYLPEAEVREVYGAQIL